MMWGNVIATFCGIITSWDPVGSEFKTNLDDVNRFMELYDLPSMMKRRVREYFQQTRHLLVTHRNQQLMSLMSPMLQGEVALRCNEQWLEKVPFLQLCEPAFLTHLATVSLQPFVLSPGETAQDGFLYIVRRGLALHGARFVRAGKVWGEDVILEDQSLRINTRASALSYLEVYTISRDVLLSIAQLYPKSQQQLRWFAIKLALKRHMSAQAKKIKEERAMEGKDEGAMKRELTHQRSMEKKAKKLLGVRAAQDLGEADNPYSAGPTIQTGFGAQQQAFGGLPPSLGSGLGPPGVVGLVPGGGGGVSEERFHAMEQHLAHFKKTTGENFEGLQEQVSELNRNMLRLLSKLDERGSSIVNDAPKSGFNREAPPSQRESQRLQMSLPRPPRDATDAGSSGGEQRGNSGTGDLAA